MRFIKEVDVIKCSNIDSCDSKRHMLGDLTNGNNDDNREGVNHNVVILAIASSDIPTTRFLLVAPPTTTVEAATTLSTNAAHFSTIRVDKYNNVARKRLISRPLSPRRNLIGG